MLYQHYKTFLTNFDQIEGMYFEKIKKTYSIFVTTGVLGNQLDCNLDCTKTFSNPHYVMLTLSVMENFTNICTKVRYFKVNFNPWRRHFNGKGFIRRKRASFELSKMIRKTWVFFPFLRKSLVFFQEPKFKMVKMRKLNYNPMDHLCVCGIQLLFVKNGIL